MSLASALSQVSGASLPQDQIDYGPWRGSMRSRSLDQVPKEFAGDGADYRYLARTGTFVRRQGMTIRFDTLTSGHETAGQLPVMWTARCRKMDEFLSDSVTDGIPTLCALLTKETAASGLDDGRFSNLWWYDQVNTASRTMCDEYATTGNIYPAPGASKQQYYVVPAIWYDSGGGGLTRGTSEIARRFFTSGSRQFQKIGNWYYFPNLNGTPIRWNGNRASSTTPNRIMPIGPFAPTHAGSLANNSQQDNNLAYMRPTSDQQVGSWIAVGGTGSLASCIDEETVATSDFIHPPNDASNYTSRVFLSTPTFTPAADAEVTVSAYIANTGSFAYFTLSLEHHSSSTVIALGNFSPTGTQLVSFTLSPTQISQVTALTSDWSGMRLAFSRTVTSGSGNLPNVYWAAVSLKKSQSTEGGWKGSDTFYFSVAYRFEDGSVWMPVIPRGKNTNLTSGFNVFTVDAGNPEAHYQSVIWSNLPIGPYGVISRLLLRSTKIDITTESPLQLVAGDLRVVWELKDNVTTRYEDFSADDDALELDVDGLFIREDHIACPRSRYFFAGSSRAGVGYGGISPVAITIAPVGRTTDYDLNLAENDATAFTQNSQYMRLSYLSGVYKLDLVCADGTTAIAATTISFTLTNTLYDTLEELVDGINATLIAAPTSSVAQWRAQIAPGVNPQAASTSLTLHITDLNSSLCVVNNTAKTVTLAGATFSTTLAVGMQISETLGISTGAVISRIDSDTQFTYTGTLTTTTEKLFFYFDLGDAPIAAEANKGYQRVISNAISGFLYFNKAYLNQFPIEKSSAWLTVATPLSVKSAPNCFSGKLTNKHTPPAAAGTLVGVGAVDNGFVAAYSRKIGVIRNTRDFGTGIDSDYRLFILNENRGCASWASFAQGPGFVVYGTDHGIVAADLTQELDLSQDIYLHPRNDASSAGTGDFAYDLPLSRASTDADTDSAYLVTSILRGCIHVNYRASGAHPNRQVQYDFSTGQRSSGLAALIRGEDELWPGTLYGWSLPLSRSMTMLCQTAGTATRTEGVHLYGWNEQNQGSTGAGRVDEFEIGETDNGTEISGASIGFPWERGGGKKRMAVQEMTLEHVTPSGATAALDFIRGYAADTYTLTPATNTSSLDVLREVKMLPLAARTPTPAWRIKWRQSAGTKQEIRSFQVRFKNLLQSYT